MESRYRYLSLNDSSSIFDSTVGRPGACVCFPLNLSLRVVLGTPHSLAAAEMDIFLSKT